jgi:transcriptional regulator with XRE-family HTH domain
MSTEPKSPIINEPTISDVLAGYRGVYARVAEKLGVDASYISRIADGSRSNNAIQRALIEEIQLLNEATVRFLGTLPRTPDIQKSDS